MQFTGEAQRGHEWSSGNVSFRWKVHVVLGSSMTENAATRILVWLIEGFIWDGVQNTIAFDKVGPDYSAIRNKAG